MFKKLIFLKRFKNKLKNLKKPAEQYVTEIEKKLGIKNILRIILIIIIS